LQPLTNADIFNSYLAGSLFLFLLTAAFFNHCLKNSRVVGYVLCVIIVMTPIPRFIYRMNNLINNMLKASPVVSLEEIKAMEYLKLHSEKGEVILVFNQTHIDGYQTYVTAFTGKETFLSGRQILNDRQIGYDDRFQFMQTIESMDKEIVKQTLDQYHIRYLYYYGKKILSGSLMNVPIHLYYENGVVTIYAYDG
jgi:hypothetical protein